jgi:hypothetical protein
MVRSETGSRFLLEGTLAEGEAASNFAFADDFQDFFPYSFTQDWIYRVRRGSEWLERWSAEIDFYGNLSLRSAPFETRLHFTLGGGVLSPRRLEGSRRSGLYRFARLLADVPIVREGALEWRSEEHTDDPLPRPLAVLFDLLSLAGMSFRFELENRLERAQAAISLTSNARLSLGTPFGRLARGTSRRTSRALFSKHLGLARFEDGETEVQFLEFRDRESGEPGA